MKPKTFYISDTHLSHKNVLHLTNRPFQNIHEMNEEIVRRWNSVVTNADTVWHLGDFAWAQKGSMFFERLNGRKHLIVGNHDPKDTLTCPWLSVNDYRVIDDAGRQVVLFHYPIYSWYRRNHGSIHLHGHVHGRPTGIRGSIFDVSVEVQDYTPRTLEEIMQRAERNKAMQELVEETEKLGLYETRVQ